MPWKMVERSGEYCVVVAAGPKAGKTVKCHPSKDKAKAHLRALYANVKEVGLSSSSRSTEETVEFTD